MTSLQREQSSTHSTTQKLLSLKPIAFSSQQIFYDVTRQHVAHAKRSVQHRKRRYAEGRVDRRLVRLRRAITGFVLFDKHAQGNNSRFSKKLPDKQEKKHEGLDKQQQQQKQKRNRHHIHTKPNQTMPPPNFYQLEYIDNTRFPQSSPKLENSTTH